MNAGLNTAHTCEAAQRAETRPRLRPTEAVAVASQAVILAQAALAAGQEAERDQDRRGARGGAALPCTISGRKGFVLPPLERGTAREARGRRASVLRTENCPDERPPPVLTTRRPRHQETR